MSVDGRRVFVPPPARVSILADSKTKQALFGLSLLCVILAFMCVNARHQRASGPPVSQKTAAAIRAFYNSYDFGGGWHMTSFGVDGDTIRVGVTIPNGNAFRSDPPSRIEALVRRIACMGAIRGKPLWRDVPDGQHLEVVAFTEDQSVLVTVDCPREYGDY
jgi:hypothetical protein